MADTPRASARRLLLVGWDGADWSLLKPLLECGRMPHVSRLVERGVMGNLTSLVPLTSPSLWTSIATGKRPDKHGILIDRELDQELGILLPISRRRRQTPAFWNMLDHHGLKGHVIGWPVSDPAERVNGTIVSDAFSRVVAPHGEPWPFDGSSVSPLSAHQALSELRVHPGEIHADALVPFVPQLPEIDPAIDARIFAIADAVAEMTTVQAAATWAIEHHPFDFVAVQFSGLEKLTHQFLAFHQPRMSHVSERDAALYGNVVSVAYQFCDLMLGRLIELVGDDVTVMVVSDHGFRMGDNRPTEGATKDAWHRGQGIFVLAGPGIREDELVHQASVLDVTPTILTLFDVPVGADMDGQAVLSAWNARPVVRTIPSWDRVAPSAPVATSTSSESDDAFAELRASGVVDVPLHRLEHLAESVRRAEAYQLAMVHLHNGRYQPARDLLTGILNDDPDNALIRLQATYCCVQLGECDLARELLDALGHRADLSNELALFTAMIALVERRPDDALASLDAAARIDRREPLVFCFVGDAYLQLSRLRDAENAFVRALAIDEQCLNGHVGLALTYARLQRWEDVVDRALTVVRLDHHQSGAHYLLGMALAHLGRVEWAIQAFETAASIRPDWTAPRRRLASLGRITVRVPR